VTVIVDPLAPQNRIGTPLQFLEGLISICSVAQRTEMCHRIRLAESSLTPLRKADETASPCLFLASAVDETCTKNVKKK